MRLRDRVALDFFTLGAFLRKTPFLFSIKQRASSGRQVIFREL